MKNPLIIVLLITRYSFYIQCLGRKWVVYWDSYPSFICLHIGTGMCAVLTADAVATNLPL